MAPAQRDDIAVVDGRLTVRDFQTDAADIVSYFEGMGAGDIARRFEDALRMGIVALKSTGTEGDINRVERAFESLDLKFNQRLDSILSTDGVFMNSLNDALKAGSDANAELLDPNNPNAPLYVLKSELKQAIE